MQTMKALADYYFQSILKWKIEFIGGQEIEQGPKLVLENVENKSDSDW